MSDVPADEAEKFRVLVYLNSGQTAVEVLFEDEAGSLETPEEVAEMLMNELNATRPRWFTVGGTVAFAGAVSALQIDTV